MQFTVSIPEVHYAEAFIEGDSLEDALRRYEAGESYPCYTGFSAIDRVLWPSRANPWYLDEIDGEPLDVSRPIRSP
jgi:hypothetical protein